MDNPSELKPASELVTQEGYIVIKIKRSVAEKLKKSGLSYNQAISDLISRREEVLIGLRVDIKKIFDEIEQLKLIITSAIGKG